MDSSKSGDRPRRRSFVIDWWINMHLKSGMEKSVDQDGVKK
jgi:hypothetical protein